MYKGLFKPVSDAEVEVRRLVGESPHTLFDCWCGSGVHSGSGSDLLVQCPGSLFTYYNSRVMED